jgi:hypothetical protein
MSYRSAATSKWHISSHFDHHPPDHPWQLRSKYRWNESLCFYVIMYTEFFYFHYESIFQKKYNVHSIWSVCLSHFAMSTWWLRPYFSQVTYFILDVWCNNVNVSFFVSAFISANCIMQVCSLIMIACCISPILWNVHLISLMLLNALSTEIV